MRASFEQSARDLLYSYIGGYTPLVVDLDGDGAVQSSGAYTAAAYGKDDLVGDTLVGGAGNDTIYAGQGDTVDGGNDNDVIYAVNAATILGGAGNDVIYAYYTTTDLTGVSIDGGGGDDTLRGGEAYFELGSLKDPILFLRTRAGIVHNKSWIVSLPYENAAVC